VVDGRTTALHRRVPVSSLTEQRKATNHDNGAVTENIVGELFMNFQQAPPRFNAGFDFRHLFALGMKRNLPELVTCEGPSYDVGASGKYVVPGAIPLGPPKWVFPRDPIPAADDSVATLHAYHFMEHLSGDDAVAFLREVERVLIPDRGVMNFVVPYFSSALMAQDLQHKSFWCEETLRNLFEDKAYEHYGEWRLQVGFLIIAGIVNRNLALLGQIVKSHTPRPPPNEWFHPSVLPCNNEG
jgi:hypothetical protein